MSSPVGQRYEIMCFIVRYLEFLPSAGGSVILQFLILVDSLIHHLQLSKVVSKIQIVYLLIFGKSTVGLYNLLHNARNTTSDRFPPRVFILY